MDLFLQVLYSMVGLIFMPPSLKGPSRKILHISDTPSQIHGGMIKLAAKMQPDIIIHTGDVVDDIKLELFPFRAEAYRERAVKFLDSLSMHVKDKLVLVPGNHDNSELLNLNHKIVLLDEGEQILIGSMVIGAAHRFEKLPAGCDYYLYGHDKTQGKNRNYLNGISHINVILVDKPSVIKLSYPAGTDDYRLKRSKIGI